jgi:hypothetical protein
MQAGCVTLEANKEMIMKYICQLAIVVLLLSCGGCALINDTPRHTVDEVTTIAKSFSPQCQVEVAPEKPCG